MALPFFGGSKHFSPLAKGGGFVLPCNGMVILLGYKGKLGNGKGTWVLGFTVCAGGGGGEPSILGVATGTYPTLGALSFSVNGLVINVPSRVHAALLAAGVSDAGVPVVTMGATGGRDARRRFVAKRHVGRDPRKKHGGDVAALVTIGDSTATAH